MPSTRQSLEIVSGLYSEKWGSKSSLNEWTLPCHRAFSCARPRLPFLFTFYIGDVIVRVKYYWLFRLKITWGLNVNIVWHVSMNFTDTIWIFLSGCCDCVWACGLLKKTCKQNWGFRIWRETLSNKRNIYWINECLLSDNIWRSSKVSD